MENKNKEMYEYISQHLTKSDIYASRAIARVSAFIIKYRQERNMTQAEFARMMGVSQGMVSRWESADYNFTLESIAQIAEKLNVSFEIQFVSEQERSENDVSDKSADTLDECYDVAMY